MIKQMFAPCMAVMLLANCAGNPQAPSRTAAESQTEPADGIVIEAEENFDSGIAECVRAYFDAVGASDYEAYCRTVYPPYSEAYAKYTEKQGDSPQKAFQKLHDRFNEDGYESWKFTRLALSDYPNPDTDAFFEAYRNWEIIDDKFIADAKADAKEIRHIRFSLYARYAGDSEDTPVLRSSEMLIIRNDSGTFVMG